VGAATGYRWYLPDPPDFWSLMRSVWNAVIGGGLGPGDNAFAWGGAMAMRRDVFHSARVLEYWKGAVSDDYALSDAVHAAGLTIAYAPGALVASLDHTGAREFLGWIRRQMIITRVYRPRLWWVGLAAHLIYCAAMVACILVAIQGGLLGEYALIAQWGLGMLKGTNRATLARAAFPEYASWFKRYGWVHTWWVPLATWIWLYAFLASATTNTFLWRGNRYRLNARRVRKL
jgi:GT2 family glycosyltransferase